MNSPSPHSRVNRLPRVVRELARQWFLACLLLALVLGATGPQWLSGASGQTSWTGPLVGGVMFLMALPIPTRDLWRAARRPAPVWLGFLICYVVTPLLALAVSPILNPDMAAGLLVVAAIPATLASAAVWTARAGGDDALALMITILTNGLCFLFTPLLVWLTLGQMAELDPADMSVRLLLLVVAPIAAAQLLRRQRQVARIGTNHKALLNLFAQIGILVLVLIGTARTWARLPADQMPDWTSLGITAVVCLAVHVAALGIGWLLARGFSRPERIAVAIAGSQKTMAVGLLICLLLNVTLIPLVIYHAVQLIADTLIADRLHRHAPVADLPGAAATTGLPESDRPGA